MAQSLSFKKLSSFTAGSSLKLKELWKPLRRFLTFSLADEAIAPQKNIAVSIEKGRLSIVYSSSFLSRTSIRGIKEYTFEEERYPQPEEIASSLSLAINEFGAKRSVQVTLALPKNWTVVRTAEFPSTVKENISNVISFEMDRLTPFTSEDSFFDFRVLKDTGERITLLVMAARADTVKPYLTALRESGFRVAAITSRLAGMGILCRNLDRKGNVLYVEMGDKGYEGAFFAEGGLSHMFSGEFPAEDEKIRVEAVSSDLRTQIDTERKEGREPQIVLHFKDGGRDLKDLFKSSLSMPFKVIEDSDIGIRLPQSRQPKPFAAIANAMRFPGPKSGSLNLLKMGVREERRVPMGLTLILLCGLLSVWLVSMFTPVTAEEERLARIDSMIAAKKDDVRKVEAVKKSIDELQKEVTTIEKFKEGKPMTLNILKELTTTLPASAWLTRVRIADKSIDIEGYASSATELLSKLEASKLLKKAEFASPTFRDARMNADRFVIRMEIETAQQAVEGEKNAAK